MIRLLIFWPGISEGILDLSRADPALLLPIVHIAQMDPALCRAHLGDSIVYYSPNWPVFTHLMLKSDQKSSASLSRTYL